MIRAGVLLLIGLSLGATAAYFLRQENGYALITFGDWVLETSLLGLVAAVVALFAVIVALFKLLAGGVSLPARLRRAVRRRRAERALESFETGMLHLHEGRWKRAEVELVRRAADHRAPYLNYLQAARAAQRQAAMERRDHYLALATYNRPDNTFAVLMTQAELQLEQRDFENAAATLRKLRAHDRSHAHVAQMLAECLAQLQQWSELLALIQDSERGKLLEASRAEALSLLSLRGLVADAVAAGDLDRLKRVWEAATPAQRAAAALRRDYVRALVRLNAQTEAAALITVALQDEWDGELVQLYGALEGVDSITRLASIELWLAQYGERPELLLTAGRACLASKLWGKARGYLEAASRIAPGPAVYFALMQLAEQTQQPEEAAKFAREGLRLAAASAASAA